MATADQGEVLKILEELHRLGKHLERLTGMPAGGSKPGTAGGEHSSRTIEELLIGVSERLEQLASQTEERGRRTEERLERLEKRLAELGKQGPRP